jgi:hypothetical protein
MVSVQEFRDARFFQGSHELKVGPLLQRYGNDVDGFKRAAERLGGEGLERERKEVTNSHIKRS